MVSENNTQCIIKMANVIKTLVSKNKKRHTEGEFNLDLSYITEQIIAMGFPANRWEGIYRNNIDDVVKFLDQKHEDKYMVYNLCSERSYGAEKFHRRVQVYPFEDHNPPSLRMIPRFCKAVHSWLSQGSLFVAAVHCKAGKGRTGVMVCCYLLYASHYPFEWQHKELRSDVDMRPLSAEQVLALYAQLRTFNQEGVTIPSQRRYVHYYDYQLQHSLEACEDIPLRLVSLKLHGGLPSVGNTSSFAVYMRVHTQVISTKRFVPCSATDGDANVPHGTPISGVHLAGVSCVQEARRSANETVLFPADESLPLIVAGDVRVTLYHKPKMMKKEKLFVIWFHTYHVVHQCRLCLSSSMNHIATNLPVQKVSAEAASPSISVAERMQPTMPAVGENGGGCTCDCHRVSSDAAANGRILTLTFTKDELDKAVKDKIHKIFPPTFKITLTFERAGREDCELAAKRAERCTSVNGNLLPAFQDLHDDDSDDLDSDPPSPRPSSPSLHQPLGPTLNT